MYLKKAKKLKESFFESNIQQISREENSHTDALANLGSAIQVTEPKYIPIIYLKWPTVWTQEQEQTYKL